MANAAASISADVTGTQKHRTLADLNETIKDTLAQLHSNSRSRPHVKLHVELAVDCPLYRCPHTVGWGLVHVASQRHQSACVTVCRAVPVDAAGARGPSLVTRTPRHHEMAHAHRFVALALHKDVKRWSVSRRQCVLRGLQLLSHTGTGHITHFVPDGPHNGTLPLLVLTTALSRQSEVASKDPPRRTLTLAFTEGDAAIGSGDRWLAVHRAGLDSEQGDLSWLRPLWECPNHDVTESWLVQLLAFLRDDA